MRCAIRRMVSSWPHGSHYAPFSPFSGAFVNGIVLGGNSGTARTVPGTDIAVGASDPVNGMRQVNNREFFWSLIQ